jgi:hypothetical protein
VVFFDQNTLAGDWRAQVRYCRENGIVGGSRVAEAHAGIDYAAGKGPRQSTRVGRLSMGVD